MTSLAKPYLASSRSSAHIPEAAVLTRAIEGVFRKLIRILIGRMSLKKLQEMIQIIFVEEAEEKLREEARGKNVPMSTLAVVTGFDTRTLVKIKSKMSHSKPLHEEKRFLSGITPECSILDIWESSPRYRDSESGTPKTIAIKGPEPSFESLVKESGSTRGVSLVTFLNRLETSGSIEVDRADNSVRMLDKRYTLFESEDQTEKAKVGMAAVGNLLDTVAHNLNPPPDNRDPFHQQGSWTNRLDRGQSGELRKLIKKFLLETDEKAREIMAPFEQDFVTDNQITAGISLFYFEEEPGTR
jgi:hypothetical protein